MLIDDRYPEDYTFDDENDLVNNRRKRLIRYVAIKKAIAYMTKQPYRNFYKAVRSELYSHIKRVKNGGSKHRYWPKQNPGLKSWHKH